jgi:hypothetical protein
MAVQVRKAVPDVSKRSIQELISLKDRRAVVTGGAKGIGFAISKRRRGRGAAVLHGPGVRRCSRSGPGLSPDASSNRPSALCV